MSSTRRLLSTSGLKIAKFTKLLLYALHDVQPAASSQQPKISQLQKMMLHKVDALVG
jgi:hypothetical protein